MSKKIVNFDTAIKSAYVLAQADVDADLEKALVCSVIDSYCNAHGIRPFEFAYDCASMIHEKNATEKEAQR